MEELHFIYPPVRRINDICIHEMCNCIFFYVILYSTVFFTFIMMCQYVLNFLDMKLCMLHNCNFYPAVYFCISLYSCVYLYLCLHLSVFPLYFDCIPLYFAGPGRIIHAAYFIHKLHTATLHHFAANILS